MGCVTAGGIPRATVRWARREEAGDIAGLFLISSDGLSAFFAWKPGADDDDGMA